MTWRNFVVSWDAETVGEKGGLGGGGGVFF